MPRKSICIVDDDGFGDVLQVLQQEVHMDIPPKLDHGLTNVEGIKSKNRQHELPRQDTVVSLFDEPEACGCSRSSTRRSSLSDTLGSIDSQNTVKAVNPMKTSTGGESEGAYVVEGGILFDFFDASSSTLTARSLAFASRVGHAKGAIIDISTILDAMLVQHMEGLWAAMKNWATAWREAFSGGPDVPEASTLADLFILCPVKK